MNWRRTRRTVAATLLALLLAGALALSPVSPVAGDAREGLRSGRAWLTGGPLSPDAVFATAAALLVVLSLLYGLAMLLASRRNPHNAPRLDGQDDLLFVFMLPCLNEERVIRASVERLLSIPGDNRAVLVIDDGSDDATSEVVSAVGSDSVWLLRRDLPEARQGKGEALNAAVRHLASTGLLAGRDLSRVIAVIVDADGRLDRHALDDVSPCFDDPSVGGVQIGIRISNRQTSRLARMQDMEFVIYTEVFQRGRRHLGSVGLGGNGQFMRLSALVELGESPWSRSLTEDLDLGVRLLALGWRNEFCSSAAVHQQGVVELPRLVRQRSRWFQGHLQSLRLVPTVLRFAPRRARKDLLYHLSSPLLLLLASFMTASFVVSLSAGWLSLLHGRNPLGWWVLTTYVLSFVPALTVSAVYWRWERDELSPLRCWGLAHLYVVYGLMWYAAGWWAVARALRGSTGWMKTERLAETDGLADNGPATGSAMLAGSASPSDHCALQAGPEQDGPAHTNVIDLTDPNDDRAVAHAVA